MKSFITISSKGQVVLPVNIRKALNLRAGDQLEVNFDPETRHIGMDKPMTIDEIRAMNQAALKRAGTSLEGYKSGDGFRHHVKKKYGL